MPDADAVAAALTLVPRSPVRCSLCNLPVVRSAAAPSVLRHQALAGRGLSGEVVDYFLADGRCPQEGAVVPADMTALIPAVDWVKA